MAAVDQRQSSAQAETVVVMVLMRKLVLFVVSYFLFYILVLDYTHLEGVIFECVF